MRRRSIFAFSFDVTRACRFATREDWLVGTKLYVKTESEGRIETGDLREIYRDTVGRDIARYMKGEPKG